MRRRLALLVLLAAAAASIATSMAAEPELRYPCDAEPAWDPRAPLYLRWGFAEKIPVTTANFRDAVRLLGPDGEAVALRWVEAVDGTVHLCPIGGLLPDTAYTWELGPFDNPHPNQSAVPHFSLVGPTTFRTAAGSVLPTIDSDRACAAFDDWSFVHEGCGGDTGHPPDTGG